MHVFLFGFTNKVVVFGFFTVASGLGASSCVIKGLTSVSGEIQIHAS